MQPLNEDCLKFDFCGAICNGYIKMMNKQNKIYAATLIGALVLIAVSYFFFFRIDLTSDKRYSLSNRTKMLMEGISGKLEMTVYLDGDLNPGFLRLKKSTAELLDELSVYSPQTIDVKYVNPSLASTPEERSKNYTALADRGLIPTAVYERDKEGKTIQKVIFPWVEMKYNGKKVAVGLLKNVLGNTGDQNLNVSIENLEFEITDGIRRAINNEVRKIAFIEGHGELDYNQTLDISKSLVKYFQVDRGVLGMDASVLKDYKAIIIAAPKTPFSETDKFIIDQYVMHGGRVLWLLDGVRIARENLSTIGMSPAMALDLNLDDQLFRYGVRINPVIVQDVQCSSVPLNIAPAGEKPQFEPTPWYWSPLLLTSPDHPITRNVTQVKADFCSGIDLVGDNKDVKSTLLLITSNNTHIVGTPTTIDLSQTPKSGDKKYFNLGYVPVAVALEGNFDSDFANRMTPKGMQNVGPLRDKSLYARQIVVADGDLIRNETPAAGDSTVVPLGYDRYMNQQFGNKDFIQNAILYLTDDEGWMELRNRTLKLRLLNKNMTDNDRLPWQLINVLLPVVLLLMFGALHLFLRKRKYTR